MKTAKNSNGFIHISVSGSNIDRYYHRTSILNALNKVLPSLRGKLLDTACGGMPYRQHILANSEVDEYIGLDIKGAIHYDDEVKPDVLWDGIRMPFDDDSFDCAIATEVLEHVPDPKLFLSEIYRVLKPSGLLFFTTPFLWPLHEIPNDQQRLTPFAMKRYLSETGFYHEKVEPLGGWHASMAQMLGLWLKRGPMTPLNRKVLTLVFFPFYKYLLKKDRKNIHSDRMITGISGYAIK